MDSEREQPQGKRRGRPAKVEHRRTRLYGNGLVYLGPTAKELGFDGTLVPIYTSEAILLVRPGTTGRVLRRCIEVAALRMMAEEESGVVGAGESVERVVRLVRSRLEGMIVELEQVREAHVSSGT